MSYMIIVPKNIDILTLHDENVLTIIIRAHKDNSDLRVKYLF